MWGILAFVSSNKHLYYVTNRKESSPAGLRFEPGKSGQRYRFFGPHRSQDLAVGQFTIDHDEIVLTKIAGIESIEITPDSRVVVFVPGYNTRFADSLRVLNQLQQALLSTSDLVCILFSWPSMGSAFAYMQDECSVQFSYPHFKQLVDSIAKRVSSHSQISLVGHSLGCQLVHRYVLDRAAREAKSAGMVVLASPDIDYQTATLESERLKFSAGIDSGFILVSDVDGPLEVSRSLHGYTRLGRPSLSTMRSLFWGTFRTGSLSNIFSTLAHVPIFLMEQAVRWVKCGLKDPDQIWQEQNQGNGIAFADNISLFDFTRADRMQRRFGHTICVDLVASLLSSGSPPAGWDQRTIVKIPDEYGYRECFLLPYSRHNPYGQDQVTLFSYRQLIPPPNGKQLHGEAGGGVVFGDLAVPVAGVADNNPG